MHIRGCENEHFAALFDGHGGKRSAEIAASCFYRFLSRNWESCNHTRQALVNTFKQVRSHIGLFCDGMSDLFHNN